MQDFFFMGLNCIFRFLSSLQYFSTWSMCLLYVNITIELLKGLVGSFTWSLSIIMLTKLS